jgi:hypothetical protein
MVPQRITTAFVDTYDERCDRMLLLMEWIRFRCCKEVAMLKRLVLCLSLAGLTGCASIADHHYQHTIKHRSCAAWKCAKNCIPCDCCSPKDFEKGFKAGWVEVAQGGNGCLPPVPPKCYWKPCYQDCEGMKQVKCWYDGYCLGAQAQMAQCLDACPQAPNLPPASVTH